MKQFTDELLNFLKPYHLLFISPAIEQTIVNAAKVTTEPTAAETVFDAESVVIKMKGIDKLNALLINLYLKAICNAQSSSQTIEEAGEYISQFKIPVAIATKQLLPEIKKQFTKQLKKSPKFLENLQQESEEEKKRIQIQAIVTACKLYCHDLKNESDDIKRQIFSLLEALLDSLQKIEENRSDDFSGYVTNFRKLAQACANIIAERTLSKAENGLKLIKALEEYDEGLAAASCKQKMSSLGIFSKSQNATGSPGEAFFAEPGVKKNLHYHPS